MMGFIFYIFSYIGFQHLFVPYSPEEDILLTDEFQEISESYKYELSKEIIIPPEIKNSFLKISYIPWIEGSYLSKVSFHSKDLKFLFYIEYFNYGNFEYYEYPSSSPLLIYNPFAFSFGIMPTYFIGDDYAFSFSLFYSEERVLGYRANAFFSDIYFKFIPFKELKFESDILKNLGIFLILKNLGTKPAYHKEYIRTPPYFKGKIVYNITGLDIFVVYLKGLWKSEIPYEGFWVGVKKRVLNFFSLYVGGGKRDEIGLFGGGVEIKIKESMYFNISYRPSEIFQDIMGFSLKYSF